MNITGWNVKYQDILLQFGYSRTKDHRSAVRLDSILKRYPLDNIRKIIHGKPVFVIGAGPSLSAALPILKKYKNITKICADTAITALIQNGIRPQIVVTDLDGDLETLQKIGRTKSIMVVHAHGDNSDRLEYARGFKNCIGTTQTKKVGKIHNFGGFTDGDRCVFLADFFGAGKIFLFGMDFGTRIGRHSNTEKSDRVTKLKKLKHGKMLLEWLAPQTDSDLFTLSKPIRGFKKITYRELRRRIHD